VEMTETANILNNATSDSLVLMDEVGRGTSTFDGLSLAWSSALHLANNVKAFTLFATHYFEMTELENLCETVKNVHLKATEHDDKIIFLHNVLDGSASKSYGLQVAQLAGVPMSVVQQAKEKLSSLEASSELDPSGALVSKDRKQTQSDTLTASTTAPEAPSELSNKPASSAQLFQADMFAAQKSEVESFLRACDIDSLSPREALNFLYELQSKMK